jgi:hypothetical protein
MNGKLLTACGTPTDVVERDLYEQLVLAFAPVARFDPTERFFPVDLVSAVAKSAIYQVDADSRVPIEPPFRAYGQAVPADLTLAGADSFTTLVGWDMEQRDTEYGSSDVPVPRLDAIYEQYSGGGDPTFDPRLTCYATLCRVTEDLPNYHFFEQFLPSFMPISAALREQSGVLLNYYFYFPALESTPYSREGDWSGISLFFERMPDLNQPDTHMPLLACYFRKMGDFLLTSTPEGPNGFRLWSNVEKLPDQVTGLMTHPIVYVSRGLHNCYFWPLEEPLPTPVESPWYPRPDPDEIESGGYSPGPAIAHVVGGWKPSFPWYSYVFSLGIVFLFELCGARGCEFDKGGIPTSGYEQTDDSMGPGGYESDPASAQTGTTPGSDSYPSGPPGGGPLNISLNVRYVDLEDEDTKNLWGYGGFWGAAKRETYEGFPYWMGSYSGVKRPNLAPWFLWNLFWDAEFGSDGGASGYRDNGP